MGVIYKLKPEVKDFILEEKKVNPQVSCRNLAKLVQEKFNISLSKSSINLIFKEAGLSMPVGRRRKRPPRQAKAPKEITPLPQPLIAPELPLEVSIPQAERPQEEILPEVQPEATPPIIEKPTPEAMPLLPFETERQQVESPKAKQLQPIEPEALEIPMIEEQGGFACPGAILLKAADYLIGGSFYFADAIREYIRLPQAELLSRTEGAIYLPLCEALKIDKTAPCPWPFLYRVFSKEELFAYLFDLKNNKQLTQDLKLLANHIFQEVRCVKINYADGNSLYLDGQLHTIWSTPHIPYSFVTPIQNIKSYVNSCFFSAKPFVIFAAPGYDVPPKEFFSFMLSFGSEEKRASRMNIFGNRLEELGVIPLEEGRATHFVFGLLPWQFGHYRNVLKLKEFKPFQEEMSKQNFYLAEIELELSQPDLEQTIQLRGCALKNSLEEKIRFVILSNMWLEQTPEGLANLYLQRWPNLEESFQDYSRKIELLTYTASPSADIFSTENLSFESELESEISLLFGNYLKILDTFVRMYFLPFGYENKDFLTTSERFYGLKTTVQKQKEAVVVTFNPPAGYKFLADLTYACRRVNEREVVFAPGYRLWLQVAPL